MKRFFTDYILWSIMWIVVLIGAGLEWFFIPKRKYDDEYDPEND